jgi:hypothetical protein
MRQSLSIAVLVVGLVGLWTGTLVAEEPAMIELATPRPAARAEAVEIQVTTGPLPPRARLELITEGGEILGGAKPFGPPGDRGSTTVTVPVPRSAMVDGRRLRLRLQVVVPGAPPRAPRPGEVERLDLVVVPQSE